MQFSYCLEGLLFLAALLFVFDRATAFISTPNQNHHLPLVRNHCLSSPVLFASKQSSALANLLSPPPGLRELDRNAVLETIKELEKTYDPSTFTPSQLSGKWRLLYTCNPADDTSEVIKTKFTSVSTSKETFQEISLSPTPTITNIVVSEKSTIRVGGPFTLDEKEPRKAHVKFTSGRLKKFGIDLPFSYLFSLANLGRGGGENWLLTTYIDESLRIGVGSKGSIFVLTKESNEHERNERLNGGRRYVNNRVGEVSESATLKIFASVIEMRGKGLEITSLCVGEPDFNAPPEVIAATCEAAESGKTKYTSNVGILPLREAVKNDLNKRKGMDYSTSEIIVCNGAKQACFQSLFATVGVGDKVIVPSPYYPSYPEMVKLIGGKVVYLETDISEDYKITGEKLSACLGENPDAKVLMLCNPSNPTGSLHTKSDLEAIAGVLSEPRFEQINIVSDEIYERLCYGPDEHVTFAKIKGMRERTLTVNGWSKSHAMTGYRLAYLAAPKVFIDTVNTIQGQVTGCASAISQHAAVAALTEVPDEWLENNMRAMKEKRDFVIAKIQEIEHVRVSIPDGAFYVFVEMGHYTKGDDVQFCLDLLQEKQVALVPGSGFGKQGSVRISYAASMKDLENAMGKLADFLGERA